ncbi:MAG: CpsD/CapB family tyrosine-protein kinase [Candidatus Acidiferrales bacterium]
MSRIHEALKKAEQERAAIQSTDAIAPAPEATPAVRERRNGSPAPAPEVLARPAVVVPPPGDYLRFDDLRQHCAHPQWHLDPNMNVFFNSEVGTHGAEQFRTLRSRLYQLRSNQPLRTLLITSAIPTEGKTFVASNLAQAIVRQPDRRVLLIDADLRRPRLHVQLGAPLGPGLSDYLRGEADEMAVIQHGQEGNLCLIAGGNEMTDPSELLSNGRLKILLDRMTPVFDWVILDSPPCLPVADAGILANLCDGVLMVVRSGTTPAETAQRACQELKDKNLIGAVLNAVDETDLGSSYYYHAYGQNYGNNGARDALK